jgi:hypothetical protein
MNTRVSQDLDRQAGRLTQLTGGPRYFVEAPGPGAAGAATYIADPCIRLGAWAANNREGGVLLQAELQNRTPAHRLHRFQLAGAGAAGGGVLAPPSAAALGARHPLALPAVARAGLVGPFDTFAARDADGPARDGSARSVDAYGRRPLVEAAPPRAEPRMAGAPVRARADEFVRVGR